MYHRYISQRSSAIIIFLLLPILFVSVADCILAAMSVDLGSQFMKVGLVKPGVPMEIVLNRESLRKTVTMLAISNQNERAFAESAFAVSMRNPKNVFMHFIDLLGKKIDNPIVHLYQKRFPYHKLVADENRGTVLFETERGDRYSPEVLLAMILSEARRFTEKYAEQTVKDVVITVPPYFNQAERRAMATAVNISGLNLLQLINDNTAAGLNYGVFRRKDINETAQTLLVFDMGAAKTTATIFEYRMVKDKAIGETNPQMTTLGVGFDRLLGGFEMSLRMRDHLIDEFRNAKKNTVKDITENPRAMAKLLKEAERVKQVLSANSDHYAQVEHLHEEQDFRAIVTREQFETMIADLVARIGVVVDDALKMADLKVDQIDQVVLMGAATRVPKVQQVLRDYMKGKELAKFFNTDEAIALGAVFQAAHLSKGFKVKKFTIKETNLFPIQVDFHRQQDSTDESGAEPRLVHRVIYDHRSHYPAKKMLTFAKHTRDFEFAINYGDMKHLRAEQIGQFGELNISRVDLYNIAAAVSKHSGGDDFQFKGVKAHFRMDDSGIVHMENAEVVVEKISVEPESTFASIAGKISGFFGGGGSGSETVDSKDKSADIDVSKGADDTTKENVDETVKRAESETSSQESTIANATAEDTKTDDNKTAANTDEKPSDSNRTINATVNEPKPTIIKIPLTVEEANMDVRNMSSAELKIAKKQLDDFDRIEKEKAERDAAQNALEAFVYDISDKIEQDEYARLSTDAERDAIRAEVKTVREWMDDDVSADTVTGDFKDRLKKLKSLTADIFYRRDQAKDRPKAIESLKQLLNYSFVFLNGMKNLTGEMQIFTETELNSLEKLINETKIWWHGREVELNATKPHEMPTVTVTDIGEKIHELDREVKYLISKIKYAAPKTKKKTAKESNATENSTTTTGDTVPDDDESVVLDQVLKDGDEESAEPSIFDDQQQSEPDKADSTAPTNADDYHEEGEL